MKKVSAPCPNSADTAGAIPERPGDVWGDRIALAAVLAFALVLSAFKVSGHDFFWHLATGKWIVSNHAVPARDIFSFTREGMEWIDAQWLFQVVLWLFYSLLGEFGCTLLPAILCPAILALFCFSTDGRASLAVKALAGFLFLLALNPRIDCRPEMLSFFFMAALFFVLERAMKGRWAWLAAALIIQLLFVNAEGLWPVGLAITGVYAGDVLIQGRAKDAGDWKRRMLPWLAALGMMVVLSLAQPYGVKGALFPLTLLAEVSSKGTAHKNVIEEFQPIFSAGGLFPSVFIPFLLLNVVALAAAAASGRRIRPLLTLLGVITLVMALNARRNVGIGSVVMTQVLLTHLGPLAEARPRIFSAPKLIRWSGALAIVGAVFLSLLSLAQPYRQWDGTGRGRGFGIQWSAYPVGTADYLKSIGYRGNLINGENIGGYLIWSLWPDCKVFADSRMELGGQANIILALQVYNRMDRLEAVAHDHQVEAVVTTYRLPYTDFVNRLVGDQRWALVHLDYAGAVFLRRGPRWDSVIARDEIQDPFHYEIKVP
jgi:hypothetical protein